MQRLMKDRGKYNRKIQCGHSKSEGKREDMQKIIKSKLVTISSKHDKMYKKSILIRNI